MVTCSTVVLAIPASRALFLLLLALSWENYMRAIGITTFGFVLSFLVLPVFASTLALFYFRIIKHYEWGKALSDSLLQALFTLCAASILVILTYS